MTATPCSRTGCRNTTNDPTGLCHHHRGTGIGPSSGSALPPTPTTGPDWKPGHGIPHPTGGYDEIRVTPIATAAYRNSRISGSQNRRETFYANGEIHRTDGPAVLRYDRAGVIREESYYRHGAVYRDEGPAVIGYGPDGGVVRESWHRPDGELHRLDGPARVLYENGLVVNEHWLHGEFVPKKVFEGFREALESGAPEEWARAFAKGGSS